MNIKKLKNNYSIASIIIFHYSSSAKMTSISPRPGTPVASEPTMLEFGFSTPPRTKIEPTCPGAPARHKVVPSTPIAPPREQVVPNAPSKPQTAEHRVTSRIAPPIFNE
jgi:hypothetical protein